MAMLKQPQYRNSNDWVATRRETIKFKSVKSVSSLQFSSTTCVIGHARRSRVSYRFRRHLRVVQVFDPTRSRAQSSRQLVEYPFSELAVAACSSRGSKYARSSTEISTAGKQRPVVVQDATCRADSPLILARKSHGNVRGSRSHARDARGVHCGVRFDWHPPQFCRTLCRINIYTKQQQQQQQLCERDTRKETVDRIQSDMSRPAWNITETKRTKGGGVYVPVSPFALF